jgi:hypothetical protein
MGNRKTENRVIGSGDLTLKPLVKPKTTSTTETRRRGDAEKTESLRVDRATEALLGVNRLSPLDIGMPGGRLPLGKWVI